ncbi:MAG: hypothetical protein OEV79_04960 [candidate division WOR-3 bacterium]|nr:hypothetical protein [candidate division WOR-3 bacterium]
MRNSFFHIALTSLFLFGTGQAGFDNLEYLGHNEQTPAHIVDVEIVGNWAYVVDGYSTGLELYDISDPINPLRVFASGPAAWRCTASGDTLLFAFCRRSGVTIWDISGPGMPLLLGQYDPPGTLEALEGGVLVDSILYCAAHQNGIYAVSVVDLQNPYKVGEFALDSSAAWNVVVIDSFLYVANGLHGLLVIGLEGGLHPVSTLSLPGVANDINTLGNILAVSLGSEGLAAIDITEPYDPVICDTISTGGCVWGAGTIDSTIICGSWRIMELFDVTDPYNIVAAGWENTKTWAHGADIRSDSLIVVADWRGISCYKIGADPGPDIDVYPQTVDFGVVSTTAETLGIIRNTGMSTLNVGSISAPSGILINPNSFFVLPGDSQVVTVTASGPGSAYGGITYHSNDPDEPDKIQGVYKNNTSFPQAGSTAPDFTLLGSDNNYHTLSQYHGKVVFLEFGGAW